MALVEGQGITSDLVPRIATCFGGGIGGTLESNCGALSGAVMAAGVLCGRDHPEDDRQRGYQLTREVVEAFRIEFGTTICKELTGVEPDDSAWEQFRTLDLRRKRCIHFVEFVVQEWMERSTQ